MSVELIGFLFDLGVMLWAASMACLVVTFVMHFLLPQTLLKTYFKEPHFSATEIEFFSGFPTAYFRTVMFMRLVGFPSSGKKRGLTDAYKMAPSWFRFASRVIVVTFLIVTVPMIFLCLFFFIVL